MAKIQGRDEILKKLGLDPTKKATISFAMWQPWMQDDEHAEDPQGFTGEFVGFKIAQKQLGDKMNVFDLFGFDKCEPAPKSGATGFVVASSYMLEELKRVQPGTRIAVVYSGSERNVHGGQTHMVEWFFAIPADRERKVLPSPIHASNADKIKMLPANGTFEEAF